MVVNRYTNITPSRFNPLSAQELFLVPQMQRQKHDQLLAQQEALRQGLAKVNPHEKYFNEAVTLKNDLNNQIQTQAEQLAKEGINPNSTSQFIQLNRNYNEMMSPTGKLGMINNHNINLQKTYSDYLKSSIDAGNSPNIAKLHADQAIKQHMQQPLYDERGRVNDFRINQGPVKYIDVAKRVQDYAKEAGMTSQEFANASGALSYDQAGNRYVVNSNSKGLNANNARQLAAVADTLNRELSDPTSEVRQSTDYNFRNPQQVLDDVRQQLNIYRDNKIERQSGSSLGSVDWSQPTELESLEGVNVEAVKAGRDSDLLSDLERDNSTERSIRGSGSGSSVSGLGSPYEIGDSNNTIKNRALQSPEYLKLAQGIARDNKSLQGLKWDDPKMQTAVKDYLKENKDVTIQNRYVDPATNPRARLFASREVGKDKKATNNQILERALQGAYEVRDINGKLIPAEELAKYNFTYSGDMTPKSQIGNIFSNPKQNIGARRGLLTDKDSKETTKVYVSRGADDFDTPQFKAMETINNLSKIVDTQPNIYHKVNGRLFDAYGLKNVEIKYNKGKQTYNLSYQDNDGTPVDQEFSDDKFQEFILNAYGGIN